MTFIAAVEPPENQTEPAWWFVFKNERLLVDTHAEEVRIPYIADIRQFHITPVRTQYLGKLNGTHCYSAEVDQNPPEGLAFQGLRSLFECVPEDLFWTAGRAFQIMNWDRNHQYCGRCGQPTQPMKGERAKQCLQCGLIHYPRLSPAIIVAVVKENQLLLAHAPRFPKSLYSVIAGFVEPGETFEECVRREVKEEVSIDVAAIRYFGSQSWPFPHSLMVAFTAQYAGGTIQVDGVEITDAGWFTREHLPDIPGKASISRKLIDWFVANH